jgi:hypothetical protein
MRDAVAQIPEYLRSRILRSALYVTKPESKIKNGEIEIFGCELSTPRHYEWTHCDAVHLPFTMMDIDGILCPDWPGEVGEDYGEIYEEWLKNAPLKIRPMNIGTLISWRREEHRSITEAWLAKHGISYGELILANREEWKGPADFKAHHFLESNFRIMIESTSQQAKRISDLTKRPVIAFETNEAWGLEGISQ